MTTKALPPEAPPALPTVDDCLAMLAAGVRPRQLARVLRAALAAQRPKPSPFREEMRRLLAGQRPQREGEIPSRPPKAQRPQCPVICADGHRCAARCWWPRGEPAPAAVCQVHLDVQLGAELPAASTAMALPASRRHRRRAGAAGG